jgi:pectinesterase
VRNADVGRQVQAAVDSLSTTASGTQCIFIYQGTYSEQVYIPARTAQLTIYGYTTDTSSYSGNTVTISQGLSQDDVSSNDLTATLRAWNVGLKVYNINLQNTRGSGSQALAVSAQADQQGYYGVKFIGYQDTILAQTGYQVYANCYIDGAVDFIFGQQARAWFYNADIRIKGTGYITANGRDSDDNVSYYVIDNSDIRAADGVTVASGSTYLGRPWRDYARGKPVHPFILLLR